MTEQTLNAAPLDVIIVGAGISGIGMAAHLAQSCPQRTFTIIERRQRSGGTWDLFRYPGVRSDSDMYTLGFRFEPWRDDKSIAGGETILAYLDRVVETRGLAPHMRFGLKVTAADWDSASALWTVTMVDDSGAQSTLQGRFLFLGAGYYDHDNPHDAAIPGLETLGATVIHPQFWPQDFDHAGKRVIVIGSGATAVTVVPAMAETAAHVTMLQRTPTWYGQAPSQDRAALFLRKVLPERWAYALTRWKNIRFHQFLFRRARERPEGVGRFLLGKVREAVGEERFRAEDFTPPYGPWEQRMCLVPDGDLFTAIREERASVVTGRIARVDATGVLLEDGRHLEADVIVTATGLRLAVAGKIAVSLDGEPVNFADRFYYRSAMFSNVPNLAALFGYLNAGWTLRVDIVADWLCRLFNHMDAKGLDVATPHLPADHGLEEEQVFDFFSSGYLQRAKHIVPKSSTTPPWRFAMDYLTERRELAAAPIEDGVMRFSRAHGPVA
ncbi:MAG TPA: NAD(P)/FAD-dependent oxidoreductase [Novosphingobium sp.]|nr:NAD(P)/FAD-dependent oxidoreductase [Novosphingobium sp.]